MVCVSVVIPTYNHGETISRAISSALNQTIQDIELIVVDDCSTDNTKSVVESYSDERITYIRHKENQGGGAARNTGIDSAHGDFIAFLDADDYWYETKLEKQLSRLRSKSSEYKACYCLVENDRNNKFVNWIDSFFNRNAGIEGGDELLDYLLTRQLDLGGCSALLLSREVVERVEGFNEDFQRRQDIEFMVRVLQECKLACVDEVLVRKYDTGAPSVEDAGTATKLFYRHFSEILEERGIKQQAELHSRFMLSKTYFSNGEFSRGINHLRESKPPHSRDVLGLPMAIFRGVKLTLTDKSESESD